MQVSVGALKSVTAHPRYDASSQRLVGFSYTPNPVTGTEIQVFEFNDDGDNSFSFTDPTRRSLATTPPCSLTIPNVFGLFHDFVVTKNYVIFTQAPTVFGDLAANALQVCVLVVKLCRGSRRCVCVCVLLLEMSSSMRRE